MHVLLVAHGSSDPRHAATMLALAGTLRERGTGADVAYLDHSPPDVAGAVLALPVDVAQPVVAVPMLLVSAFHATVDVPAAVAAARAARPDLDLGTAGVLGPHPLLTAALDRRLAEAGVSADDESTARLLLAAGTSDEYARAGIGEVARERFGPDGLVAFASGPGPTPADAVRTLLGRGAERIAVAPYILAGGTLLDRASADARAAAADSGIPLVVAEALGAAPELADLVLLRASEVPTRSLGTS